VQRNSRQSQSPRFFFQSGEGAIAMTLASAFTPNIDVEDVRDASGKLGLDCEPKHADRGGVGIDD
jgi:hypothetical protein